MVSQDAEGAPALRNPDTGGPIPATAYMLDRGPFAPESTNPADASSTPAKDLTSSGSDPESTLSPAGEPDGVQAPNWDSDTNPWKYVASQQQQQLAEFRMQQAQVQITKEVEGLKTSGASDEQIATHLNLRGREMQLNQQWNQMNTAARFEVANRLVGALKQAGVETTPDQLLKDGAGREITDPTAMMARAQAFYETGRKTTFEKRKAAGTDKVGQEQKGGPAPDFKKMTSQQKIAWGLRRQRQ